jgi:hypothetical protein
MKWCGIKGKNIAIFSGSDIIPDGHWALIMQG